MRKIFLVKTHNPPIVVKGFSYEDSFTKKLIRHKLFAFDEAANLIIAKKRNLPVPNVEAFAQQKKGILCTKSLVAMEYLNTGIHPTHIFRKKVNSSLSFEDVMKRMGKLLLELYRAGCNHVDAHGTSFLIDENNPDNDKIIDFQFAVFHKRPMPNILSHHLSFLGRRELAHFSAEFIDNWAKEILQEAGDLDVEKQFSLYKKLLNAKELGCYERMLYK